MICLGVQCDEGPCGLVPVYFIVFKKLIRVGNGMYSVCLLCSVTVKLAFFKSIKMLSCVENSEAGSGGCEGTA